MLTAGAAGEFGLAHETGQLDHIGLLLHRNEPLVILRPKHPNQTLAKGSGRQVEQLRIVVAQSERAIGVRQGDALELINGVPQFHGIALQEIPAGRHIEEQVLHHHARPDFAGHGLRGLKFSPLHGQAHAQLVFLPAGAQFDPGNAGNAGQRLSTEAHGREGEQVIG